MIISSGHTGVYIDLGNDKPGMVLQYRERGRGWQDYRKDGEVVRSPVDIETLPPYEYRMV